MDTHEQASKQCAKYSFEYRLNFAPFLECIFCVLWLGTYRSCSMLFYLASVWLCVCVCPVHAQYIHSAFFFLLLAFSPLSIPFCLVLLPLFNLFCVSCVCVYECARQKGLSFTHTQRFFSFAFASTSFFLSFTFVWSLYACLDFMLFICPLHIFNGFCFSLFLSKHSSHLIEFSLGVLYTHMNATVRFFISLISFRCFSSS